MQLYAVLGGWDYEGFEIVGIYDSQEKAEAAIQKVKDKQTGYVCVYDYIEIRLFELNSILPFYKD